LKLHQTTPLTTPAPFLLSWPKITVASPSLPCPLVLGGSYCKDTCIYIQILLYLV
jgi:hypothetical protein